jgi:hypothetical protein
MALPLGRVLGGTASLHGFAAAARMVELAALSLGCKHGSVIVACVVMIMIIVVMIIVRVSTHSTLR